MMDENVCTPARLLRWHRQRGMTLAETLIVLAIIGAIVLFAIPNMRRSKIRAELLSQMKMVRQAAAVARIHAIRGGSQTVLTEGTVGGKPGLVAWQDANADEVQDADETLVGEWLFTDHVILTTTTDLKLLGTTTKRGVVFLPNGIAHSSASEGAGAGQGRYLVSDHLGNEFEVRIQGGSGSVIEEMKDFDGTFQPEPFRYWRY